MTLESANIRKSSLHQGFRDGDGLMSGLHCWGCSLQWMRDVSRSSWRPFGAGQMPESYDAPSLLTRSEVAGGPFAGEAFSPKRRYLGLRLKVIAVRNAGGTIASLLS